MNRSIDQIETAIAAVDHCIRHETDPDALDELEAERQDLLEELQSEQNRQDKYERDLEEVTIEEWGLYVDSIEPDEIPEDYDKDGWPLDLTSLVPEL